VSTVAAEASVCQQRLHLLLLEAVVRLDLVGPAGQVDLAVLDLLVLATEASVLGCLAAVLALEANLLGSQATLVVDHLLDVHHRAVHLRAVHLHLQMVHR
jgi:hypothetical protein